MNKKSKSSESALLGELDSWLKKFTSNGAVPVVTGMNGDMDTIGSAIALASSNSNMMACGLHLGRVAKRFVKICPPRLEKLLQAIPNGLNLYLQS